MTGPLPVQFFACSYHVPCDTYNCRNMAKWFIGRPDGPLSTAYKVCHTCAESIVKNLPDKLKPETELAVEQGATDSEEEKEITELPEAVKALLNSTGHKCNECGKMFDTEQGLIIHMTKVHKE